MKLFRSKAILVTGICMAGMLGACQQENDGTLAPQSEATNSDQNARTAMAAGTLLEDGNIGLAYENQSGSDRLWKEIQTPSTYSKFIYAPQLITYQRYQNSNYDSGKDYKYTLDTSGRCVQFVTPFGTYIFEYNINSQVILWRNKDKPNMRVEFQYNYDGTGWRKNLSTATVFNESNIKTKKLTFYYGGGAGLIPDRTPLNPINLLPNGVSKYLPVLGTFSADLAKHVIEEKYLPDGQTESNTKYVYSYTLNYSGRATNVTVKKEDGTLVSSTDRKYSAPKFNF